MVLVTDGSLGIGKGSLRHSLQTLKQRGEDKKFPLPFPFPTKMFIMCIANEEEVLKYSLLLFGYGNSVSPLRKYNQMQCSYKHFINYSLLDNNESVFFACLFCFILFTHFCFTNTTTCIANMLLLHILRIPIIYSMQ